MSNGLFSAIRADIARYGGNSACTRTSRFRVLFENYGLQATVVYRIGRWLGDCSRSPLGFVAVLPLWPIYALSSAAIKGCYDIRLALSAEIGPGLYIGHFGGIELKHCHLGSECSIAQQTTIRGSSAEVGPRIGSRVWVGAHSKIAGAIVVGSGATIGAGSKVLTDIPPGALAMGNPARCVRASYDNSPFLLPAANESSRFPTPVP
jgi:serine O-acetyltransferase